jgi:hypothetical protein
MTRDNRVAVETSAVTTYRLLKVPRKVGSLMAL